VRAPLRFVAVLAVAIAGCGGDGSTKSDSGSPVTTSDQSSQHVHGLGVNPRDGSLMIATHTGLFRAGKGERTASRVGGSEQDVMGFTVVGPDRFLGSGHPDPRQAGQPPSLGLIRSTTAGTSWSPVSLTGNADFHVLRSRGSRVFGFNVLDGSLMTSADGGRNWRVHPPPGPLVDLAIDPRDLHHLIASTNRDLVESRNDGRAWRTLRRGAVGLIAWPSSNRLVFIDADGNVHRSRDGGRTWRDGVGGIGSQPAALMAHASELYAARVDGNVVRSDDGGANWSLRARP
jgi:hypothetical protein